MYQKIRFFTTSSATRSDRYNAIFRNCPNLKFSINGFYVNRLSFPGIGSGRTTYREKFEFPKSKWSCVCCGNWMRNIRKSFSSDYMMWLGTDQKIWSGFPALVRLLCQIHPIRSNNFKKYYFLSCLSKIKILIVFSRWYKYLLLCQWSL